MSNDHVVTVSNQAELAAALKCRMADTVIVLKEGNYGEFTFNAKESPLAINLVAADPSKPPVFNALAISNANGVSIEGVTFTPKDGAKFANGLTLRGCDDVNLTKNTFVGGETSMDMLQRGLLIDHSSDIVVHDNNFSGLMRGAVFSESTGIAVTDNAFHDMRSEGMNFSGASNVEISGNDLRDFHPVRGDHPDFIQFWTNGAKSVSENIYIHDNTMIQAHGEFSVQGIYMDNDDNVAYRNIVIENNTIQSGMPHGVLIEQAIGVRVENNTVLAVEGSENKLRITVFDSQEVTVRDNTANAVLLTGNVNQADAGNIAVSKQVDGSMKLTALQIEELRHDAPIIRGTEGADKLTGTNQDDVLLGGGGDDVLSGGRGSDVLIGGAGNDIYSGGVGADRFVFSGLGHTGYENERIMDLSFAEGDVIELSGFGARVFSKAVGMDLVVDHNTSSVIVHSVNDLVELSKLDDVTISRKGKTDLIVLTIHDQDGDVVDIQLSNMYNSYAAAGGQLI